jgi:hypothetical protein
VVAVMSADWSPMGLEFVSGKWDRMVCVWKEEGWDEVGSISYKVNAEVCYVVSN